MSDKINIVRVFIGSPGGLEDERRAAYDVVNEVNLSSSEHWGCQFKLVGWEDTIPGYHRPQDKINIDLDKCDYFLGILWRSWGSKPSANESEYTSGFHEEYSRAKQRIESGHMKDLAVYFKKVDIPTGMKPDESLKDVLDFRQKCIEEKKVFFKDFDSTETFRDLVRSKLMEIGWSETEIEQDVGEGKSQSEQVFPARERTDGLDTRKSRLIDGTASEFLSEILRRPSGWEETKPHEIARFRLISSALRRSGNDELYLGNHDANLIFKKLRNSPLSKQEIRALIDSGVIGFSNQNVPLWHWMAKAEQDGDFFSRIRDLTVFGDDRKKKNAIQVLEYASQPLPSLKYFDKKEILNIWLKDESDSQIFDAAISFLSKNAEADDISLLEEVSSDCSPLVRARMESVIVGIVSRSNIDASLRRLVEKEVDKLEDGVVETLFKSPQSLVTETIALCLSAKSDDVRLRAIQLLFERNEINKEAAENLITDSDHRIRLLAAESMKKLGFELGLDVVKKALTIEIQPSPFFGLSQDKKIDETYYEHYLSNRLAELDLPTLKGKVAEAGVFCERELSVMYSKFTSKVQEEIRGNLKDGFEGHFASTIKKIEVSDSYSPELLSKIKGLEKYCRTLFCTDALSALCAMAKSKDLLLVRRTVDVYDVDGTENVLKYLARFGDWSDIERIKNLGDNQSKRVSLLSIAKSSFPEEKANAILALSKNRVADMFALELDGTIRKCLVKVLSKKAIANLSDEVLLKELSREGDEYRIIVAIRCVQSLPKKRINSLLNQYVDSDAQRYYNSVHWLDLGASIPQRLVKTIAERKLARH
ncbi:MAG: hypothetical protein COB93_00365 [Sneathiella sp.]|nr:MAG: hypothetical protein COB93_00365 [Sneathiella sp.]